MSSPIVTVSEGKLQGSLKKTTDGFEFYSYLGIPYAKPPVGKLRFQDPQLPEKWDGIRDATIQRGINAQFNFYIDTYEGEEDCLFLNVFVPKSATEKSKLPVLCYIHGGGFYLGNGTYELNRIDYLVQQDIIVVTMNYRLGALGFLCLNTPEVPGNAGFKDQAFSLRWVHKNIRNFGGDPENVTIMGESAGAASVHFQMMSPMSKGLFVRAIMQSGSCVSEWSKQKDPELHAFAIAEKLGLKKTTDKREVLEYLRSVPVKDLVMAAKIDFEYYIDIWFTGVVEKEFPECEAFLLDHPENLMKAGNYNVVPCIQGITSHEALLFYTPLITEAVEKDAFFMTLNELKSLIKRHTKCDMTADDLVDVHHFYFKNEKNHIQGYIDLISDLFFVRDGVRAVKFLKMHTEEVYYYYFGYGGEVNIKPSTPQYSYDGAGHEDDNVYLFKKEADDVALNASDSKTRKQLIKMWTDFVKFGNPTPKTDEVINTIWNPVKDDTLDCLKINGDLEMVKNPFCERVKFLEKITSKYCQ